MQATGKNWCITSMVDTKYKQNRYVKIDQAFAQGLLSAQSKQILLILFVMKALNIVTTSRTNMELLHVEITGDMILSPRKMYKKNTAESDFKSKKLWKHVQGETRKHMPGCPRMFLLVPLHHVIPFPWVLRTSLFKESPMIPKILTPSNAHQNQNFNATKKTKIRRQMTPSVT